MTISHVEPVKTYVSSGNGAYPFTFKILAESDIEVWYTSASTGARVQLVRGSDFSVTVSNPGGTVTILDNAPAGGQILIQRRVPIDQPTNWVNNGPFDMDLLEADLDRIIMIAQQLHWDVSTGQAAINYRGPWVTPVEYAERDIVRTVNGNYYFCVVRHTSGTFATDLAAGAWVLLIDFAALETLANNAAASAASALASRNTAIARSAAAELSEIAAAASAAAAAADADEIRDWPVSTGLATDVAEHLAFSRKNLLINGGFDVWQDGPGPFTTDGYCADGWYFRNLGSPGNSAERAEFGPIEVATPRSPKYYLILTAEPVNGCSASARIEYLPQFSGKTLTCSFWTTLLTGSGELDVQLNSNFGTGGTPSTTIRPVASSPGVVIFPGTTVFERRTVPFTVPDLSSHTLGTTENTSYLELEFSFLNIDDSSSICAIADVQLELGDTVTDFEYRHPAEELALCQWYYEKATVDTIAVMLTANQAQLGHMSYAPKRKAPTITLPASATVNTLAGTPGAIIDASARTHGFAPMISWTGGTAGAVGRMRYTDVIFDARL